MLNKTLREISEEVVEIVNNESTDYDSIEKVVECLEHNFGVVDHIYEHKYEKSKEDIIKEREEIVRKWNSLDFLKGVHTKEDASKLYESMAKKFITGDTKNYH